MASTEIPNRAAFKSAEVCAIAGLQPYVLRTWEAEFPDLGVENAAQGVLEFVAGRRSRVHVSILGNRSIVLRPRVTWS